MTAIVPQRDQRGISMQTLPERIADDLGSAIARGEFTAGERLREQEIAERFGVSRGPAREAIRALAQRGLAIFYPRRGAYVVDLSIDAVIDLFNTRAVLLGLAARYFAAMAELEPRTKLNDATARLEALGAEVGTDPIKFARAAGRIGAIIAQHCGSPSLGRLLHSQVDSSAWGTIWRHEMLDYVTRERRLIAASDYVDLAKAIARGDGANAETAMRRIMLRSQTNAVAVLSGARGETFDERRLLSA